MRPARRHQKCRRYRSLRGGSRGGAAPPCHRGRAHAGVAPPIGIRSHGDFAAGRHLRRSGWTSAEHDIIRGRAHEDQTAVIAFDLEGIAVSSGAGCSSDKVQPSRVLAAMEISPVRGAVRVSLGLSTGEADIERVLAARRLANALCRAHSIVA